MRRRNFTLAIAAAPLVVAFPAPLAFKTTGATTGHAMLHFRKGALLEAITFHRGDVAKGMQSLRREVGLNTYVPGPTNLQVEDVIQLVALDGRTIESVTIEPLNDPRALNDPRVTQEIRVVEYSGQSLSLLLSYTCDLADGQLWHLGEQS